MADPRNKELRHVHLAGYRSKLNEHSVTRACLEPLGRLFADDDPFGVFHGVEAASDERQPVPERGALIEIHTDHFLDRAVVVEEEGPQERGALRDGLHRDPGGRNGHAEGHVICDELDASA